MALSTSALSGHLPNRGHRRANTLGPQWLIPPVADKDGGRYLKKVLYLAFGYSFAVRMALPRVCRCDAWLE